MKHRTISARPSEHTIAARHENVDQHPNVSQITISQVFDPTQHTVAAADQNQVGGAVASGNKSNFDSEGDFEYIPHTDDNGQDSEVVELRRHVRKFKKIMKNVVSRCHCYTLETYYFS